MEAFGVAMLIVGLIASFPAICSLLFCLAGLLLALLGLLAAAVTTVLGALGFLGWLCVDPKGAIAHWKGEAASKPSALPASPAPGAGAPPPAS